MVKVGSATIAVVSIFIVVACGEFGVTIDATNPTAEPTVQGSQDPVSGGASGQSQTQTTPEALARKVAGEWVEGIRDIYGPYGNTPRFLRFESNVREHVNYEIPATKHADSRWSIREINERSRWEYSEPACHEPNVCTMFVTAVMELAVHIPDEADIVVVAPIELQIELYPESGTGRVFGQSWKYLSSHRTHVH